MTQAMIVLRILKYHILVYFFGPALILCVRYYTYPVINHNLNYHYHNDYFSQTEN